MTVVERNRNITAEKLAEYIPMETHLPMVVNNQSTPNPVISEAKEKLCIKFSLI
jgi:hypothetical protein